MVDVTDVRTVGGEGCKGGFEPGPANGTAIVRVTVQGRKRIATEMWNEHVYLSSQ
jgi:hypothetical protein